MTASGPSRHFAAMQHFRRFRTEADIEPPRTNPDLSTRPFNLTVAAS
jgi:hypothetical protein